MYYTLKAYKKIWRVEPTATRYTYGESLAVVLNTEDGEPFATLTVNIPDSYFYANDHRAFVDTNNCPWAEAFLKDTGIATPAGVIGHSGYCDYPLYDFDLSKIVSGGPV